MKNKKSITVILLVFLTAGLFAQKAENMQGNGKKGGFLMNIPDLTDAQKDKLQDMRTAHMKEMKPLRNELKEKEAHLETLQTSDNPDMKEIFAEIDKISAIRTDMAKKNAEFRQEIRKVLTDDQRVYYDMHAGKHRKKMMKNQHMQK